MLSLINASFLKPRTVVVFFFLLFAAGLYSYENIPKQDNPDITIPIIFVRAYYSGASPSVVLKKITIPLENRVNGIAGIKKIQSYSDYGVSSVMLHFDINYDMKKALVDVKNAVSDFKSELPSSAEIFTQKVATRNAPSIILGVSGNVSSREIINKANQVKLEMLSIPGISKVITQGIPNEIIEVQLNRVATQAMGIDYLSVVNAIQKSDFVVSSGKVESGGSTFRFKSSGLMKSVQELQNIIIRNQDVGSLKLGDVAVVKRKYEKKDTFIRLNGKPAVFLSITKLPKIDLLKTTNKVEDKIDEINDKWQEQNVSIDVIDYRFYQVDSLITIMFNGIVTAVLIIAAVCIFFMGLASGLLVCLMLPISFAITFFVLLLMGIDLNTMIFFGFIISVGIMVDSSIIIVELAVRKRAEGLSIRKSYIDSVNRMFWPIIGSASTTFAVFLPMIYWPGVIGQFMSYLPITAIIVLSVSLIVSLFLLPILGFSFVYFGKWIVEKMHLTLAVGSSAVLLFILRSLFSSYPSLFIWIPLFVVFLGVFIIFRYRIFGKLVNILQANLVNKNVSGQVKHEIIHSPLHKFYYHILKKVVDWPIVSICSVLMICTSVVTLYFMYGNPSQLFVEDVAGSATVSVELTNNSTDESLMKAVDKVTKKLLTIKGVANVVSGADTRLVVNPRSINVGKIEVIYDDIYYRRSNSEILDSIKKAIKSISYANVSVYKTPSQSIVSGRAIDKQVISKNRKLIKEVLAKVRMAVKNDFSEYYTNFSDSEDNSSDSIEWYLKIDKDAALRAGVSPKNLGRLVSLSTSGLKAGRLLDDATGDELDIMVYLGKKENNALSYLFGLKVDSQFGFVPVAGMFSVVPQAQEKTIKRQNGFYGGTFTANFASGDLANNILAEEKFNNWLNDQHWSEEVDIKGGGNSAEQGDTKQFLIVAVLVGLLLMLLILLTLFNNFYFSIITIITVLLSFVGVLLGILITGGRFSLIMSGCGTIALAGIVANNAIILIDSYKIYFERKNINIRDAIVHTAVRRLRPILLTTGTTVLGVLPLALQININLFEANINFNDGDAALWSPFAIALIYGMLFSTVLTLISIPAMLVLPARLFGNKRQNIENKIN